MQIVDEFGMEIGGGLVVRTPSGFAPKYSPGCPLGFRAMVATANETQQPYSVNRNTSQRLPSQRKRNSSLVHLSRSSKSLAEERSSTRQPSSCQTCLHRAQNLHSKQPGHGRARIPCIETKGGPCARQELWPRLSAQWRSHRCWKGR